MICYLYNILIGKFFNMDESISSEEKMKWQIYEWIKKNNNKILIYLKRVSDKFDKYIKHKKYKKL